MNSSTNGDIGIIGDVHQRLAALQATLDRPLAGCGRIVVAGDFLDRGPDTPTATLNALLDVGAELIVGNHELAYLGGPAPRGLIEERTVRSGIATTLRDLVLDGQLRAATAVGDVLVVHGGVSREYWASHLDALVDAPAIAANLNRALLTAVARRDFRHPAFGSLGDRLLGPFWAHLHRDLLEPGLPPLRQAVGHVIAPDAVWISDTAGAVFPLDRGEPSPGSKGPGVLGHLRIAAEAAESS